MTLLTGPQHLRAIFEKTTDEALSVTISGNPGAVGCVAHGGWER